MKGKGEKRTGRALHGRCKPGRNDRSDSGRPSLVGRSWKSGPDSFSTGEQNYDPALLYGVGKRVRTHALAVGLVSLVRTYAWALPFPTSTTVAVTVPAESC